MSAFFGAVTASIMYSVIKNAIDSTTKAISTSYLSRLIAIIATFSLAFSLTFWAQAEMADVYIFNAFFISSMLLILLKWAEKGDSKLLYLLSLVLGLSLGAHMSNVLFIPPFLIFIYLINHNTFISPKNSIPMILLFLTGVMQFVYILVRSSQHPEYMYSQVDTLKSWLGFISGLGEYHELFFGVPLYQGILNYLPQLLGNFSLAGLILGIIGISKLFKKNIPLFVLLGSMFLVNVLFFAQYSTATAPKFLPSFLIFSIFVGIGLYEVAIYAKMVFESKFESDRKGNSTDILKQVAIFIIALLFIITVYSSYAAHIQDTDLSGSTGFPYFAHEVMKTAPNDSVILANWGTFTGLKYFQIIGHLNPGIDIIAAEEGDWPKLIDDNIDHNEIFIVQTDEEISKKYYTLPTLIVPTIGTLYRVQKYLPVLSAKNSTIQNQMNIDLAGNIEFQGYNVSKVSIGQGEHLSITYYWKSLRNTSDIYIVYTDFLDETGKIAFEEIHEPLYSIYPTSEWKKGDSIKERYIIAIPPNIEPGTYQILLTGVWYSSTTTGNPNENVGDRIPLGNIEIKNKLDESLQI